LLPVPCSKRDVKDDPLEQPASEVDAALAFLEASCPARVCLVAMTVPFQGFEHSRTCGAGTAARSREVDRVILIPSARRMAGRPALLRRSCIADLGFAKGAGHQPSERARSSTMASAHARACPIHGAGRTTTVKSTFSQRLARDQKNVKTMLVPSGSFAVGRSATCTPISESTVSVS
jgi:hypothetical protein